MQGNRRHAQSASKESDMAIPTPPLPVSLRYLQQHLDMVGICRRFHCRESL